MAKKDGGISQQTASFYLAAARRFVWWLSARARVPVRADLFDGLPGFDPKSDRRHDRRGITPRELAAILDTARSSQREYRDLTGEDRYHLYLVAFATGFRAGEVAVLCPENFELDAAPPVVVLPAKHTKNKKPVRQPLPPGVAEQLRSFLRGKPAGRPVWPGTWSEKPVKMLRADLAAAGAPYSVETVEGPKFADFHALRHTYLSSLAASGVGPKELQELTRHSDPRLTLGVYTHARPEALGAAAARLQLPGSPVNPLSCLTREQLEAGFLLLAGLVSSLFAPPFAPATGTDGDSRTPARTKRGRKASA